MRGCLALVAAVLLALASASEALAWGPDGHRLIGEMAYARLTPAAKAAVDALIAKDVERRVEVCPVASLADAALWPDCVRAVADYNWMAALHYDDIPMFGLPDKAKYCADGKCASATIESAIAVLKDKSASDEKRLIALYELAHFVGDIQQPLHAIDNADQGGNLVKLVYLGETEHDDPFKKGRVPFNLHYIWDISLVSNVLGTGNAGRDAITALADAHQAEWSTGNAEASAQEGHLLAVTFAYGLLPVPIEPNKVPPVFEIKRDYVDATAPVVRQQLAKAVLRLASVLNDALGE